METKKINPTDNWLFLIIGILIFISIFLGNYYNESQQAPKQGVTNDSTIVTDEQEYKEIPNPPEPDHD